MLSKSKGQSIHVAVCLYFLSHIRAPIEMIDV